MADAAQLDLAEALPVLEEAVKVCYLMNTVMYIEVFFTLFWRGDVDRKITQCWYAYWQVRVSSECVRNADQQIK